MSKVVITQSDTSNSSDYDEEEDTASIATSEASQNNQVRLAEDQQQPTFGNIAVANSTDIHFGNKTYYQGPVTIKQILYANSKNSECDSETATNSDYATENPSFISDDFVEKVKVGENVSVAQAAPPREKDPSVNVTLPPKLKIIPRSEWLAQPPIEPLKNLVLPIPFVVISHTATDHCLVQATCRIRIRDLQTLQIEGKGLWDIAFNFLVGGDGYAYEGRGWKKEGAHTFGYNSKSIGITFVGTFHKSKPPAQQILAAKQLIEKGIEMGMINSSYSLFGEKQLQDTLSPGAVLYEEIQTWDHWKNRTIFSQA